MAQHFLHKASTRDFSIFDATDLTPDQANNFLATIRWGSIERQICPTCGVIDSHYYRANRYQWRCKHCDAYFSVTSSTVFQDRKLSLRKLITGAFLYSTAANGISALELARSLQITVKTAFVFLSKLREAVVRTADLSPLSGSVQIDGAHFCAKPRKPNRRRKVTAKDVHDRLSANKGQRAAKAPRTPLSRRSIERLKNRRVILVSRQTSPEVGLGAVRTMVGVALHENEAAAMGFAESTIAPGAVIWTDENPAYNRLSANYEHETVKHSIEFVSETGVNDNQCESFNSRIRRAEYGVFHGFRPKYLTDYAWEFAWREDSRRTSARTKLIALLKIVLSCGRSQWWRGYWEGLHREKELLFSLGHRQNFVDLSNSQVSKSTNFRRCY